MWTEAHRARHEAGLKHLLSLQAVGQIAAWLKRADPPRSGRATPSVAVVAGIWWHLRVGGPWRSLPPGYPPWRTVYGWFRRWQEAGLFDVLLRRVARRRRRARGRTKGPRLAVIDTQSVKCIPVRGPRGYDAAKRWWGASASCSWTRTGPCWPWRSCQPTCRTGTAWKPCRPARPRGRACAWRCWTAPSRPSVAATGATSMGCAIAWSRASPDSVASWCSNGAGSSSAHSAPSRIEAACSATVRVGSMCQRPVSPVLPSWPPSRPSTIPSPSKSSLHKTTQTGSER